jgi:hypothetical protein
MILAKELSEKSTLLFNMSINGPTSRIATFLDPVDRDSFLLVNKNLRLLYFRSKAFRIPFEMPSEELRVLLPTLQLVGKIIVTVNVKHLSILKELPELRHLAVEDDSAKPLEENNDEEREYEDDERIEEDIEEEEIEDKQSEDQEERDGDDESDGHETGGYESGQFGWVDDTESEETKYLELDLAQRMDPFMKLLSTFHNLTDLKLRFHGHYSILELGVLAPLTQLTLLDMSSIVPGLALSFKYKYILSEIIEVVEVEI